MNTLEFYAVEARKHGMTYGQYEAAIRNGEIPKPKMPKCVHTTHKPKETPLRADDSIPTYRKCKLCEKMFPLPKPESKKRYCPDCIPTILREYGAKRRTLSDYTNCELCGAEFYRGRQKNGNINFRKMCPVCYDKWVHMNREQKIAFKQGERTLERLEVIRRGYKTDC